MDSVSHSHVRGFPRLLQSVWGLIMLTMPLYFLYFSRFNIWDLIDPGRTASLKVTQFLELVRDKPAGASFIRKQGDAELTPSARLLTEL